MTFQPQVHQQISIEGTVYTVAEHPRAPGMPFGQEGRAATVYQLAAGQKKRALKVFKPRFQVPSLVSLSRHLATHASLPGLQVCQRTILTPAQDRDLLRQHSDLLYAALMPWIDGPTWMEVVVRKEALTSEQSLALARALVDTFSVMEQEGLAHTDLSGPNLILPMLSSGAGASRQQPVALVDVEQMFGPELRRPEVLASGSPGYAHRTAHEGLWSADADRFSGAVLLAEMLTWCEPQIREATWGESYFDPAELQLDGRRYSLLLDVLTERWGTGLGRLLQQVWLSSVLQDCPTFGAWSLQLPVIPDVKHSSHDGKHGNSQSLDIPRGSALQMPPGGSGALVADWRGRTLPPVPTQVSPRQVMVHVGKPTSVTGASSVEATAGTDLRSPVLGTAEDQLGNLVPTQDIDQMFDEGVAAYKHGEWSRASELLGEVVRRQPGYRKSGQSAEKLLRAIAKDTTSAAGDDSQIPAATRRSRIARLARVLRSWLLWVIVTALGWSIGLFVLASLLLGGLAYDPITWGLGAFVGGMCVGLAQWLALRDRVGKMWIWAPATGLGWAIGLGATSSFGYDLLSNSRAYGTSDSTRLVSAIGWGLIAWFVVGLCQWLVIHRRGLRSLLLAPVSAITGALCYLAIPGILSTQFYDPNYSSALFLFAGALTGVLYGCITGIVVMWAVPDRPNADAPAARRTPWKGYSRLALLVLVGAGTALLILYSMKPCGPLDRLLRRTGCVNETTIQFARIFYVAQDPGGRWISDADSDVLLTWAGDGGSTGSYNSSVPVPKGVIPVISPNGKLLATSTGDTLQIWGLEQSKTLITLADTSVPWGFTSQGDVLLSRDGEFDAKGVELRRTTDGRLLWMLQDAGSTAAIDPMGRTVAVGASDGSVHIWDVTTRTMQGTLRTQQGEVRALSFSPDGTMLVVSGWYPRSIELWQVNDGKLLTRLEGMIPGSRGGYIFDNSSIAFSPDGQVVAVGLGLGTSIAKLWRVADGKLLQTLPGSATHTDGNGTCNVRMRFSLDGSMLTATFCQRVQFWQIR